MIEILSVEVCHQPRDRVTVTKLDALASDQTYANKYDCAPPLLRATMVRHGALAERSYAEGFDILRIVGTYQTNGAG